MDSKKTNLTPELKEIYDRVMNTKGAAVAPASTTPPPTAIPTPQPVTAIPTPQAGMPPIGQPSATPPMPSLGGINQPPPPAQPLAPPPGMPAAPEMPSLGTNAEQALTSTPARPISEGNTFSFNGGDIKPTASPSAPADATKKKPKISLPLLIVLGVVFIVVWGVFWAIVLGLIQR